MRTSDAIWQILNEEVDTVFFLPGGGSSFLVDSLGNSKLFHVSMLHEQGAGYAAVGYAMLHGFGVCLTTSGPGATNAITPCLAAWMDSIPVLFISGNVARSALAKPHQRFNGTQECKIVEVVKPITKRAVQVNGWPGAVRITRELVELAKNGRPGPCWLDVPNDVQAEEVDV